jgi:hypothetical protein
MALKTIEVQVTPEGDIIVETSGYQGKGCDAMIQAFAGDQKIVSETLKPEGRLQQFNPIKK